MTSVQDVDPSKVNRIHGISHGKLYKSSSIVSPNSTIPTKYQTVIVSNADKKGFYSTSRRFQYEMNEDTNPGPGAYTGLQELTAGSPSWSKRGVGGLASKTRRSTALADSRAASSSGGSLYQLPSALQSRVDFNKAQVSRLFHQNIAHLREKRGDLPGPNQYNLANTRLNEHNVAGAKAAFKSTTKRELLNTRDIKSLPAPNQYNPACADKLIHDADKAPVSSFKSQSKRLFSPHDKDHLPGPGAYHPFETTPPIPNPNRFQKQHYLCLSAPALALPPTPPLPGPGQYNLAPAPVEKHFMSSSMFLSNASRWGQHGLAEDPKLGSPGPAQYQPTLPGKQTFLYNGKGLWV